MTMTRQHFQLIADVIERAMLAPADKQHIAQRFATELAMTNHNFDRARFLKACDVEE